MKICLVNMDIAWKNKEQNLASMDRHIQKAKSIDAGIDTVVFPELSCVNVFDETTNEYSEELNGFCVSQVRVLAKKYEVNIIAGFFEKSENEKPYNASFAVNKKGELVGSYRKNHLYSESIEVDLCSRGEKLNLFELDGWKCGIAICFDIRFPRLFEALADAGAEVIFVPANWTQGENKFEMLKAYIKARAGENQVYCASVDRIGKDPHFEYTGSWALSDPIGVEVSETFKDVYHIGKIEKSRIAEIRKKLPLKPAYKSEYIIDSVK